MQRSLCGPEVHPKHAPGDHSDGGMSMSSNLQSVTEIEKSGRHRLLTAPKLLLHLGSRDQDIFVPNSYFCSPLHHVIPIPVPCPCLMSLTSLLILLEPCSKLPEGWDMCLGCWDFALGLHICLFFQGLQLFQALMCSITEIIAE